MSIDIKKPESYIMENGIDLKKYADSHDKNCLHSVLQFLQIFKWDKEVEEALDYLIHKKYKAGSSVKSKLRKRHGKRFINIDEPAPLRIIVGMCHKCGGVLKASDLSECESKKTGRITVFECDDCTYYREIFRQGDEFIITEGE